MQIIGPKATQWSDIWDDWHQIFGSCGSIDIIANIGPQAP